MATGSKEQPNVNVTVNVFQKGDGNVYGHSTVSNVTSGTGSVSTTQGNVNENPTAAADAEILHLSGSIIMYRHKPLCKPANIYLGLLKSGVTGDEEIAIKYLPHDNTNIHEAKVLHDIGRHENVVTLLHSDTYDKGPFPAMFIAMELCKTKNLHDLIKENKKKDVPFNPELSLSQSKQVLLGLHFIHEKKVINRDLKPQNILISLDGETLKISDFGWSKPLRNGRSVTKQSLRGAGTDGYRAPETYNANVISLESDIYSLALLFYFIWSYGCHPFGDDPDDWNSNIKKNRDRDLSKLLILRKDAALHLLKWMLQFVPKKRPKADDILKHPLFTGEVTEDGSLYSTIEMGTEVYAESTTEGKKLDPMAKPFQVTDDQNISTSEESVESSRGASQCQQATEPKKVWHPESDSTENKDSRPLSQEETTPMQTWPWKSEAKTSEGNILPSSPGRSGRSATRDPVMNEEESLKAILEEDNCQTLMNESRFAQALVKLQDLVKSGRNEISTQLMIAECDVQIGRNETAKTEVSRLSENLRKSDHSARELSAIAEDAIKKSQPIRAVLLLPYIGELCVKENSIEGMESCISKMDDAIKVMANQGGRAVLAAHNFGFPYMKDMVAKMRKMPCENEDSKTLKLAQCFNFIGGSYHEVKDYQNAVEYYSKGLDLVHNRFGDNGVRYGVLGSLLNNIATAHHYLGNYQQAETLYQQSIYSREHNLEYNSEEDKERILQETWDNLKRTRSRV